MIDHLGTQECDSFVSLDGFLSKPALDFLSLHGEGGWKKGRIFRLILFLRACKPASGNPGEFRIFVGRTLETCSTSRGQPACVIRNERRNRFRLS